MINTPSPCVVIYSVGALTYVLCHWRMLSNNWWSVQLTNSLCFPPESWQEITLPWLDQCSTKISVAVVHISLQCPAGSWRIASLKGSPNCRTFWRQQDVIHCTRLSVWSSNMHTLYLEESIACLLPCTIFNTLEQPLQQTVPVDNLLLTHSQPTNTIKYMSLPFHSAIQ